MVADSLVFLMAAVVYCSLLFMTVVLVCCFLTAVLLLLSIDAAVDSCSNCQQLLLLTPVACYWQLLLLTAVACC